MKWTYDSSADLLYLRLRSGTAAEQDELADGTIIDLDDAGQIVGFEVLRLRRGFDLSLLGAHGVTDAELEAINQIVHMLILPQQLSSERVRIPA